LAYPLRFGAISPHTRAVKAFHARFITWPNARAYLHLGAPDVAHTPPAGWGF